MQNALNNDEKVVELNSHLVTDAIKKAREANIGFANQIVDASRAILENVSIVKKDGTKEKYNVQKVVNAVKKSAARMLIEFFEDETDKICDFVNKNVVHMKKNEIGILEIHNNVESVLEEINPRVAQSYRNYRNYKTDFVHMLDKVFQESQNIMYI